MRKHFVVFVLLIISFAINAQEKKLSKIEVKKTEENSQATNRGGYVFQDRTDKKGIKNNKEKPPITAYKIISIANDTTYVDTTLTSYKDYKFNYLRKDDFELLPINNVGQTYNSLAKREEYTHLLPLFGARARHFNFMEAEDINYYHVPTPLTELYFKTTFEQGQQLDAFFTVNTSPRLNLSIAYKGVRSLGKYQHALSSTGNFRATASYNTKNERYYLRTHFVSQDLLNQENGGLSESGVNQYLSQDTEFADRASIEVRFENAENVLKGKRFYLNHEYRFIKKRDSSNHELALGHVLDITDKSYQFDQDNQNDLFGDSFINQGLSDKVALEDFTNEGYLRYNNDVLGEFKVKGSYTDYNYGYNSILTRTTTNGTIERIPNRIKGDVIAVGGEYKKEYKGFHIKADGMTLLSGDFSGNYVKARVDYSIKDFNIGFQGDINEVAPNYNFLLYQSDYKNYNWQNDFDNVETQKVQLDIKSKKYFDLSASYKTIKNYTYFNKDADSITTPRQYGEDISVFKIKASKNFTFLKVIGFDNTIQYQKANKGEEVYRIPDIITRNTLYYKDYWFKRALYLQTGVTFKYFSSYKGDAYDPVLSEFYIQDDEEIGGFPQIDLFFNAKIRQTRIFFKVENFAEAFSQNTEFSAPRYAYRDAVIRFGLVWNFFL